MKQKIISLLKQNKLPKQIAYELKINVLSISHMTDFYYIKGLCESIGLNETDFYEIINETFDDIGLKYFY